ncbi:MAG: O-antigen ligase family protein, partial [Parcubacteria group bacterium]
MISQTLRRTIFIGLFVIPFIPFLVSSAFFFPFITTKAFVWRIIIEIIFAAWVLLALIDVNYRPKKSVIVYTVLGFLAIIGLADLFGVAPLKSFWSNFERMEGFVSLLHLGAFFVVTGSVLKEIDWTRWWNTSLVASALMAFYALFQVIGVIAPNQAGARVDGTFGNAIYLAVYMLFHIFIATLFMWREWKNIALRWTYGLLIFFQLFILYHTATRGAILGLLGGVLVVAILSLFNKNESEKMVRKAGIAILLVLTVLVGGFFSLRNAEFVTSSPVLSRFSSLTIEEIKTQGRYFIWPIAWQGFKERPLLGWGQDNFNYVFNKHYVPEMQHLEPWFDRAHNIFLDWLVVGGAFGLLAYLSLYASLLYLLWKPARRPNGGHNEMSHVEKTVLTGLVAAYFFHNFFVFDHLVSYILFFLLLSYVHHRNSGETFWTKSVAEIQVRNIALPAVSVLLILSLYFVNIKPIMTNIFLIEALKSTQTPGETVKAITYFEKAHGASRLGQPEVMELVIANSVTILTSDISLEEKNAFFSFAKEVALKQTEDAKGDARYELLTGSFLSATGFFDEALIHLERAKDLMPGKQIIYLEIANAFLNKGENEKAIDVLKYVGEISPDDKEQMEEYIR